MVMMFEAPFHDELTSTIGPGSKKRRMPGNGYAFLRYAGFMRWPCNRPRFLLHRGDVPALWSREHGSETAL